ncbi:MAG: hypothetical protein EOO46_16375 [Flavobacterium sp.]|nr:MAG: hypothetical protein EOO46_16375 [Flavobacterium sp.]
MIIPTRFFIFSHCIHTSQNLTQSLKMAGRKKYGKVSGGFLLPPSVPPTKIQQAAIGQMVGKKVAAKRQKKKSSASNFKGLAGLYS